MEKIACARLTPTARQRSTPTLAARDLAIIMRPSAKIDVLIEEIDRDPTCTFWAERRGLCGLAPPMTLDVPYGVR